MTLVRSPGEVCWGIAYRIEPGITDEILAKLDYREKGGYDRLELPLYFKDGRKEKGFTYFATTSNPNYLGQAEPRQIAEQIMSATGPSGPNIDYLLNLELALRDMNTCDPHVSRIAAQVRKLQLI